MNLLYCTVLVCGKPDSWQTAQLVVAIVVLALALILLFGVWEDNRE